MTEKEIIAKYGKPGENQVMCTLPYAMRLAWQPEITVSRFQCHKLVKTNVETIFNGVLSYYGRLRIKELGLDLFGGCLNVRPMRGSTKLSIHAWGLAIDIDPARNQLKWNKDKAELAKPDYDKFWQIVEKNGGYSLGRLKNYDWMHFQFVPIV